MNLEEIVFRKGFRKAISLKNYSDEGHMFQKIFNSALALLLFSISAKANDTIHSVPGEYVVKLKRTHFDLSVKNISNLLGVEVLEKISPASGAILVRKNFLERQTFSLQALKSHAAVENVEPNFIYKTDSVEESHPNDPMLDQLWGLINTGEYSPGIDVDVRRGWEIETGSKKIVVAVIDSGVSYNHEDLAPNMWTNKAELDGVEGVDDDGNGFIDDIYGYDFANNDGDPIDDAGHGSHCSGTIGAKGNNAEGVVGVAWDVRIMGVKFLTREGRGTLANAIKSIDYATLMGANVMNNSWGGGGFSNELKSSIERARDAGILFVAAAGNSFSNNDKKPAYPASYDVDNIISVAAIERWGRLAGFSSYGRKTVDIGAPGKGIVSTVGYSYSSMSGTSMAAPHVSGVAALIFSHVPGITMAEVRRRIIDRSKPLIPLRSKVVSNGIVSAFHALTDTPAPVDPDDPFNWEKKKTHNISTPHPYPGYSKLEWTVSVPGAKRIAIYFSRFETIDGVDWVSFYDVNGEELDEMSGDADATFSRVFYTDTVIISLYSRGIGRKYGFDIPFVAYQ